MRVSILAFALVLLSTSSLTAAATLPPHNLTLTYPNQVCTALRAPPTTDHTIRLRVPGTAISLSIQFHSTLLSATETSLCIIESLSEFFAAAVRKKGDSDLPLNRYKNSYGDVVIRVNDFMPPTQHMTYATLVAVFRGLALFGSLYGYFEVGFEVWEGERGHVGSGSVEGGGKQLSIA